MNHCYRTLLMKVCKVVCRSTNTVDYSISLKRVCGRVCRRTPHPPLRWWPVAPQSVASDSMFFGAADLFVLTQTDCARRAQIAWECFCMKLVFFIYLTFSCEHASVLIHKNKNHLVPCQKIELQREQQVHLLACTWISQIKSPEIQGLQ